MADDNLPEEGTVAVPGDFDEAVSGLSKLMGDQGEPDPATGEEEQAAEANVETEEEAQVSDAEDDFPDAEDVGSLPEADEAEGEDGQPVKGGQFAPDNAKIQFEGRTITIADLKSHVDKRVKDFQRGFTEKTQALSAKESEVDQLSQSLGQFRDYMAWYAETLMPKPPGEAPDPAADPHGYQMWQVERDRYAQHVQAYQLAQGMKKEEADKLQAKAIEERKELVRSESAALERLYPFLRDPNKRQQFWSQTEAKAGELYGFTPQEVQSVVDHRFVHVLRDAIAYRKIKASAPQAKEEATKRSPLANGGKRADPNANARREMSTRSEQLRKTGDFDTGVALLKTLVS